MTAQGGQMAVGKQPSNSVNPNDYSVSVVIWEAKHLAGWTFQIIFISFELLKQTIANKQQFVFTRIEAQKTRNKYFWIISLEDYSANFCSCATFSGVEIDPYIEVQVGTQKRKTKVKKCTNDPVFEEVGHEYVIKNSVTVLHDKKRSMLQHVLNTMLLPVEFLFTQLFLDV